MPNVVTMSPPFCSKELYNFISVEGDSILDSDLLETVMGKYKLSEREQRYVRALFKMKTMSEDAMAEFGELDNGDSSLISTYSRILHNALREEHH